MKSIFENLLKIKAVCAILYKDFYKHFHALIYIS